MKKDKIRPILKYILERIRKADRKNYPDVKGLRFYAYLSKNAGELVKVTVAVKNYRNKWYYKQCAVHGIHSDICFIKDMVFHHIGGYNVGWYEEGLQKKPKWYEDKEWDWQEDKWFDPYAPIVNKEYLASFPQYKYAAWELYEGANIFKYLRTYEKYPQVEYLVKAGLTSLVYSKQILRKTASDKAFCKWMIRNKDELIRESHYIKVILRAYKSGQPIKDLQAFEKAKIEMMYDDSLRPLKDLFKGKDLERFFFYIVRQDTNTNTYLDYLRACNYLGVDMKLNKNRFPHDFRRWHDIRIDEYATARALKDKETRKELYEQFALIAEKYRPLECEHQTFIVKIAESPADLIREGEILHHCVGRMNYDQRFIREESLIFFVRNGLKPSFPFVTVEYSPKSKKVLQCYGELDKKPSDTVIEYVNKVWLPYANKQIKKIKTA